MANEIRIRTNFIGGKVDDNPLTSGATTMNSNGLAAAPAVDSAHHFPITIDPDGVFGNPEIVYVTALTAGATSATIARGQEGTSQRQHNQDEDWVHGVLVSDISPVLISQQILASPAASITFSSIPQTYNHLRLMVIGRTATATIGDTVGLQFNGDTSSSYSYELMRGVGGTLTGWTDASTGVNTSAWIGDLTGTSAGANEPGLITVDIPLYAGTTWHKVFNAQSSVVDSGAEIATVSGGRWASTAAITSVKVISQSGNNLAAGSAAFLYGVV